MPLPPVTSESEARALMGAGLARAELEFVMSVTAPLFWIMREAEGGYRVRNGSAFFLDAGGGVFGVTAAHVIDECRQALGSGRVVSVQLGDQGLDLDGRNAIIAADAAIDIATFRVSRDEVAALGKTVLTGYQRQWPPGPPQRDRGVYYGGFPGTETIWSAPREISFGAAPGGGIASSVSESDVSSLIERDQLLAVLGRGLPPENYDFRGMSGGPMLTVIEDGLLRSWSLAGVIYEGPNPSPDAGEAIAGLEIIRARRAHFILPDGGLDLRRWQEVNAARPRRF
jgi:hypothetical protein